ncbi:methyl-accepting chemotaxis protein [Anaeromicropila populeti]|uniref:methyl-accepting chemotaxis protein n=1 Tax=Anaeromicropila populeti TaxID=37658 RepID=UPI0015A6325E|nr:methyl-accepting chemotaxis protein [Anaeromicropila populeti]
MKNLKMKNKLAVLYIATGLIPTIVLAIFIFLYASQEMRTAVLESNTVFSTLTKEQIESYFSERNGDAATLSTSNSVVNNMEVIIENASSQSEKEEALNSIDKYLSIAQKEYGYTDIYLTDAAGKVVYAVNMKEKFKEADLKDREYIQSALKGQITWSKLFYSDIIQNNMMTLSAPVYAENNSSQIVGTINLLLDQNRIDSIVHQGIEKLGETGDAYLINKDGLLLSNTKLGDYKEAAALNKTISTSASQFLSKEIANENNDYCYVGKYKDYLKNPVYGSLSIVKVGSEYDGLIIEQDVAEAFKGINALRSFALSAIIIIILLSIVLLYVVSTSITKPLMAVVHNASELAEYRLTNNVLSKYSNRKDEVGEIGKSVQLVIENLRMIIKEIVTSSEQVSSSSEELTANSQELTAGSEEVARTMNEIAMGAGEQAESTTTGAEKVMQLGRIIDDNRNHINEVSEASTKTERSIREGLRIVNDLSINAKQNSEASQKVYQSILMTSESSKEIAAASNIIADIAEQTNLLSLNAAIEAARAGEHGKGFAIVAEEIKKLAEQSAQSTKKIDYMVQKLERDSDMAVKIMADAKGLVHQQELSVEDTKDKFNEISRLIGDVENAILLIDKASQLMELHKSEVLQLIESLAAVAEENAASTQEVSASMEEQTASIEEISNASESLSDLAISLRALIEKFKI